MQFAVRFSFRMPHAIFGGRSRYIALRLWRRGGDGNDASSTKETVLHSFGVTSTDGIVPQSLVQGKDGNIYGITSGGGVNRLSTGNFSGATGDGTFYKITPAGVETVLYAFGASDVDGLGPSGSVIQATEAVSCS